MNPRRTRMSALVLATAGMAAVATPASAQFGEAAGLGEVMNPYFLRRDLPIFAAGLGLDDGQAAIVESLFWDYEDAQDAAKARMMDRFTDLQDELQDLQGDRDRLLEVVFEPIQEQANGWDRLNEQFLQNIQAVLSSDQLERWDSFLREMRREKELPSGKFSGESLNLYHVVRDLDLDKSSREALEPALNEYGIVLDVELRQRQDTLRRSRMNMFETLRSSGSPDGIRKVREQIDSRTAVRDVNLDSIELVAQAMPGSLADEFRTLAWQSAFPRAYRATAAQRLFDSARELESISPEVRSAIETLYVAYRGELSTISARIADLIQTHQPAQALERAQNAVLRMNGQEEQHTPDPTRTAFRERQDLDKKYAELIRGLLTDEQFAELDGSRRFLPQPEEEESPAQRKTRMMENMRRPGIGANPPDRDRGAGNGGKGN